MDNMFGFLIDVTIKNETRIPLWEEFLKEVDSEDLVKTLQYLVQDSLLGGIYMTRPFSDLINGYWDPNLEFLKEGDFVRGEGDPSASSWVSVNQVYVNSSIVNDKTDRAVYTGHKHLEQVKQMHAVHGDVSLNKISPFFTGTKVMHGISYPYLKKVRVNGSDGL